jgi:caffeoyl-CoA O-methyltransferase
MTQQPKSFHLSADVHAYLVEHGTPPDAIESELIDATRALGGISVMQVAPEQGAFLTILTRMLSVRHAVEVGTFTGYSSLCIARGLTDGGRLTTCDISKDWTSLARKYWEKAGVADRIELRIGPAIDSLRSLPEDEPIDLGFIDADKPGYPDYYEEILKRLRPGGVILVDNVLWSGSVVDATKTDPNTEAIRAFNDKLAADERVDRVMLPIADGLSLARRR